MNEIEKMYKNAGVEKLRYCFAGCEYAFCNSCDDCNVADKMVYPQFTAEKELKLIKWLLYHELIDYLKMSYTSEEGGILDISIKCMSGYSYKNDDDDDFDIALASLINGLWQDLTEEEKQQIKEILE